MSKTEPMAVGVVLFDFDGTLAHRPGMWSQCVLEVLDDLIPDHEMSIEDVRPHLRDGFPWHRSDQPHPQLNESEGWWRHVGTVFAQAFRALGVDEGRVSEGVAAVRSRYCDPSGFQLFPDTIPALRALRTRGWSTVILSNHVPELQSIVDGVGLGRLVDDTLSSASTGYEKPHPEAFYLGLRGMDASAAWMVGDNPVADVRGAEAVGIRAILVRRTDCSVKRQAESLAAAAELILGDHAS